MVHHRSPQGANLAADSQPQPTTRRPRVTDLATALIDVSHLGDFEGQPVVGTTVVIRNTGDGLSEAMKVEPTMLHAGDTVHVVLECTVVDVGFPPQDRDQPGGPRVRRHVLKAGTATFVDGELVAEALAEQERRIEAHREAATGQSRLPGTAGNGATPDDEPGMYDDGEDE